MNQKSTIPTDCAVVASKDHVSCNLEDELVILSLRTGEYYGLNAVGNSIWNLIQEPRTIAELCDDLLKEYSDVTREQCMAEVVGMLEQMAELQLVEIRERKLVEAAQPSTTRQPNSPLLSPDPPRNITR